MWASRYFCQLFLPVSFRPFRGGGPATSLQPLNPRIRPESCRGRARGRLRPPTPYKPFTGADRPPTRSASAAGAATTSRPPPPPRRPRKSLTGNPRSRGDPGNAPGLEDNVGGRGRRGWIDLGGGRPPNGYCRATAARQSVVTSTGALFATRARLGAGAGNSVRGNGAGGALPFCGCCQGQGHLDPRSGSSRRPILVRPEHLDVAEQ